MSHSSRIAQLTQIQRDLAEKLNQARELTAELAEHRFEEWSPRQAARATVDGNGQLLSLHIADGALGGPRAAGVGPEIVAAVAAARALAGGEQIRRLRAVFPRMFPDGQGSSEGRSR
jgi:YbaB/EbfC DNA-binding family